VLLPTNQHVVVQLFSSLRYFDWSWRIDSLWSTDDPAASALRLYIGPPGTIISLLRTARWISPLRVQSPMFLLDPLVLYAQLLTGVWSPKSKVHGSVQSPVEFRYFLLHTALSLCPQSLHFLILFPWSLNSLILYLWSPNSLRRAVTAVGICGELFNSSQASQVTEL